MASLVICAGWSFDGALFIFFVADGKLPLFDEWFGLAAGLFAAMFVATLFAALAWSMHIGIERRHARKKRLRKIAAEHLRSNELSRAAGCLKEAIYLAHGGDSAEIGNELRSVYDRLQSSDAIKLLNGILDNYRSLTQADAGLHDMDRLGNVFLGGLVGLIGGPIIDFLQTLGDHSERDNLQRIRKQIAKKLPAAIEQLPGDVRADGYLAHLLKQKSVPTLRD